MLTARPARRAASSPRGFAVPGNTGKDDIGEGRGTPPRLAKTYPPNPTREGWYPRKYAYCTIYRK